MIPRAGHMCHPACGARQDAMDRMAFLWSSYWKGWIDLTIPTRSTTTTSTLWFTKQKLRRYRDEPYIFTCCPFCGADLPETNDHQPRRTDEDDE